MPHSAIYTLVRKEILVDWRDKKAWASILLYVLATVYLVYLAFEEIVEPDVWNALIWVIILFTAFNVVSRSYDQDGGGRALYLYSIASAEHVFLAKTLYSSLFMLVIGIFTAVIYSFFLPYPLVQSPSFSLYSSSIILGSVGLACTLSLVSAIAWKTSSGPGMIAILGIPVIIPLLMAIIRYSEGILSGMSWALLQKYALALLLLILLTTAIGYLLFPYLWRE